MQTKPFMQTKIPLLLTCVISIFLIACSDKKGTSAEQNSPKPSLVTVTQVKDQALEITEESIGSLESLTDPVVAAEVAARVIKVHVNPGQPVKKGQLIATLDATDFGLQRNEAQTEVARIQALLANQDKIVTRNQALVDRKFISQITVDNDIALRNSLKQQLEGAKARVGTINHTSSKTNIFAPTSGVVETKLADTGDFVKVGDPIVQIISKRRLRAHLPFPEQIAAKLKPGLKVRLTTPTTDEVFNTVISELKPMIAADSRTVDVIADVFDTTGWQPGASVTGSVILGERDTAMMVPEQSVILRPAGEVVYVVRHDKAYQAIVKTGLRKDGMIEITEGVKPNDIVVVDGAGFLTDNTPVKVNEVSSTQKKL